jgi:GNAT superfamily N-acetyltransferase
MGVRRAGEGDLPVIEDVLTRAFTNYPWTRWTVPEQDHDQRVRKLQRIYVEHVALPTGAVWIDDSGSAAAACAPPGEPPLPDAVKEDIASAHGDYLPRLGRDPSGNGLLNQELLRIAATDIAWTLAAAGVLPEAQGHGLGTAVCRAGLGWLDERGLPCVLQTSAARNVGLYRRLGFETLSAHATPGGPPLWTMYRPAGG